MKAAHLRNICRQAFDRLIAAVEAGRSETLTEYLKAMGRFHRYSIPNAMLIRVQRPDATHVAGFGTWRKLGRYVRKGEKGIAIMAPVVRKRAAGQEDKEAEEEVLLSFRSAHIFDISQTEGRPLPGHCIVKGDPADYMERLKELICKKGIRLDYSDRIGSAEGYSAGGRIILRKSLAGAQEFSVMVHELAHEMLHKNKSCLPRDKRVVETEAEAVAFVVCHGIGLDVNTASSDYIQLYDGDKDTLMSSLQRIQSTASEILKAILREDRQKEQMAECLAEAA